MKKKDDYIDLWKDEPANKVTDEVFFDLLKDNPFFYSHLSLLVRCENGKEKCMVAISRLHLELKRT